MALDGAGEWRIFSHRENAMMSYYRARNGAVDGPFRESQLRKMWEAGTLLETDVICAQGTEEWESPSTVLAVLESLEDQARVARAPERSRAADAVRALAILETRRKSPGLALVLNLLIPGLGHLYVGRLVTGAMLFALTIPVLVVALVPLIGWLVALAWWVLCMILAMGAAQNHNAREAEKLGLS